MSIAFNGPCVHSGHISKCLECLEHVSKHCLPTNSIDWTFWRKLGARAEGNPGKKTLHNETIENDGARTSHCVVSGLNWKSIYQWMARIECNLFSPRTIYLYTALRSLSPSPKHFTLDCGPCFHVFPATQRTFRSRLRFEAAFIIFGSIPVIFTEPELMSIF